MAKYPYIPLPGSRALDRPYMQLWLSKPHNQKHTLPIRGLIDSGADVCLASKDIALGLGIPFDQKEETLRIGTATSQRMVCRAGWKDKGRWGCCCR